jgi:mevalonate kinase
MTSQSFYASGKLLISGEYLVMLGATALAIPLRFGQHMKITEIPGSEEIIWNLSVLDKPYFNARYQSSDLSLIKDNDTKSALFVQGLLDSARHLNPAFIDKKTGLRVDCMLGFDIRWGLGSSSSLIYNVAGWAGVDPLELHKMVSKGSGYDVACAGSPSPILFQIRDHNKEITPVKFNPPFSRSISFVYLGHKKDTQTDVELFLNGAGNYEQEIKEISRITMQMADCASFVQFACLIQEHELIMTGILGKPSIKSTLFSDFPGEIKSLGAWGGDFAMVLWPQNTEGLENYFVNKNYPVLYGLKDIIYDPTS